MEGQTIFFNIWTFLIAQFRNANTSHDAGAIAVHAALSVACIRSPELCPYAWSLLASDALDGAIDPGILHSRDRQLRILFKRGPCVQDADSFQATYHRPNGAKADHKHDY